jgi:hypothetical protein
MDDPTVDRLPGGYWTMDGRGVEGYFRNYIERMLKELKDVGVKFYIERMNEYDALDWPDDYMVEWHRREVEYLKTLGVKPEALVASASRNWEAIASQVGVYSWHGVVRASRLATVPEPHSHFLVSGDGGWDGTGRRDARGRAGLGAEDAIIIGREMVSGQYWGYEYMDRGAYAERDNQMDASAVLFEPLEALLAGAREALGIKT